MLATSALDVTDEPYMMWSMLHERHAFTTCGELRWCRKLPQVGNNQEFYWQKLSHDEKMGAKAWWRWGTFSTNILADCGHHWWWIKHGCRRVPVPEVVTFAGRINSPLAICTRSVGHASIILNLKSTSLFSLSSRWARPLDHPRPLAMAHRLGLLRWPRIWN